MKRLIFSAALLAATCNGVAGEFSLVGYDELAVGAVFLGDTDASVAAVLGLAERTTATGEGARVVYPGLSISLGWLEQQTPGKERRVFELVSTSPRWCAFLRCGGAVRPTSRD